MFPMICSEKLINIIMFFNWPKSTPGSTDKFGRTATQNFIKPWVMLIHNKIYILLEMGVMALVKSSNMGHFWEDWKFFWSKKRDVCLGRKPFYANISNKSPIFPGVCKSCWHTVASHTCQTNQPAGNICN